MALKTRRWIPFTVMVTVVLVALMSSATPSPLYVDYQGLWGTSGTVITMVYAAYCVAVLVPLLLLGRLSDAIGRRPVVMAGMVLVAASMVLLAVAPNVAWLFAGRVVQGFGVGLVTGAAGAAIVELHPRRDARIGALVNGTSINMGIAVGVMLAGLIAMWSPLPLVYPYVVIAVASALLVVAVPVLVPETVVGRSQGWRDAVRLQPLTIPPAARGTFILASVCVVVSWSVGGVYLGLGGALIKDLLGRSDYLVTGLVVGLLQAAAAVSQLLWNLRADKAGPRSGVLIGVGVTIVGLVAASVAVETRLVTGFVLGVGVVGVGMGLLFLMGSQLAALNVPDQVRGRVLSAFFVVAYLSLGLPAVVAAFLAGYLGLAGAYHLLAGVVAVLGVIAAVIVARSRILAS